MRWGGVVSGLLLLLLFVMCTVSSPISAYHILFWDRMACHSYSYRTAIVQLSYSMITHRESFHRLSLSRTFISSADRASCPSSMTYSTYGPSRKWYPFVGLSLEAGYPHSRIARSRAWPAECRYVCMFMCLEDVRHQYDYWLCAMLVIL